MSEGSIDSPEIIYGRLLESVNISGYTMERACIGLEYLLDADRWKEVGARFEDIDTFLKSVDLSQFRIAVDRRKKLARRLEKLQATQRATAKALGVDHETVRRDLGASAPKQPSKVAETPAKSEAPGANAPTPLATPGAAVGRMVERQAKKESRKIDALASEAAEGVAIADVSSSRFDDVCSIRCCSFEELLANCRADVIITDPPYPREFIPLYGRFAEAAKNSGIPVVAVMCGQTYFPTILADMCRHLDYRWLLCYLTPGGTLQQWSEHALCGWKPVVLFGGEKWVHDVFRSDRKDKRFHEWGQSLSGLTDLVDRLSEPGQTVCDPFCGGGSTGAAALLMGRRFVGCDTDQSSVDSSIQRCRRVLNANS